MSVWYGDNPNCGRCGHLNSRGFCNMTACLYPCETGMGGYINKPQTNYDRLISKTPEELAEFLTEYRCVHKAPHCREANCTKCWLDWLKSPVDKGA